MHEAKLVSAKMLSPNVRELTFATIEAFAFKPGQWVNLYFPDCRNERGEPLKRAYSIASEPRKDGRFEVAVTRVTDGPASTGLHSAQLGQTFRMSGPHGVFVLAPLLRPVLMIATGTGVVPFRSMLRALDARTQQPMVLLFGVRDEQDLLYREEFEALARRGASFAFYPTLSRWSSTWEGKRGYVQTHLQQILDDLRGKDCDAYVCGLAKMVHDVRHILSEELGVDRKQIHVERFD
jgi:ferredoxin-NADP reductase